MMVDAVAIMAGRKISELPVVDAEGRPVGLIDITDVVALLPKEADGGERSVAVEAAAWRVVGEPERRDGAERMTNRVRADDVRSDAG